MHSLYPWRINTPVRGVPFRPCSDPSKPLNSPIPGLAAIPHLRLEVWNSDGASHHVIAPRWHDGQSMTPYWRHGSWHLGLGMCAILALWVAWDCIWGLIAKGKSTIGSRPAFAVFRACGGLLLLQWFWGFSVFMWNRYRVNYIFLFDFNPRIVSTPVGIVKDAVDNTLLYMSLMLLYYKVRM